MVRALTVFNGSSSWAEALTSRSGTANLEPVGKCVWHGRNIDALCVHDGNLFVGGDFPRAGGRSPGTSRVGRSERTESKRRVYGAAWVVTRARGL